MSVASKEGGSASPNTTLGRTIGDRFRVDAVIGEGAMGVVYRAHHMGLRKDVALKLLHRELTANAEMVARFDREAAAASRLDHVNCVRVLDFGSTEDERSYLVMELLDGQELATLVGAPLPPDRAIGILEQVLHGLAHAHAHGLVHRDVKPENVFLTKSVSGEVVKLLDFGIAKILDAQGVAPLTRAGAVFGTPSYMSPEQCAGKNVDQRTDLYSAGVVMYELLTGDLPFGGDDPTEILRGHIMRSPPPMPSSIPKPLRDVVMRMMEKKLEDRFPTANATIAALEAVKRQTGPASAGPPPRRGLVLPPPVPGMSKPKPSLTAPFVSSAAPAPPVVSSAAPAPPVVSSAAPAPPLVSAAAPAPPLREAVLASSPVAPAASGSASPAPPPPAPTPEPPPVPNAAAGAPASPGAAPSSRAIVDDAVARVRAQLQQRPWLKPALAGGAALLLVIVAATWRDDDGQSSAVASDADDPSPEMAADEREGATRDDDEDAAGEPKADDEVVIDREQGDTGDEEPAKADRALRANLASIDALLESKHYDSARIMLGPLLEVYGDEPGLHWRMGKVLLRLNPKTNATAALESYRNALSQDAALLDDPVFAGELWPLLDQPKHRVLATEIAVELLGEAAHDRLAKWINVQASPLPHATRHRAIDHLTAAGKAGVINAPLQVAMDLWQAQATDEPCEVFAAALATAGETPDSFLWGSIVDAPTPTSSEGAECPGVAQTRDALAAEYAVRYAGLGRIVPSAYAKKRRRPR